MKTVLESLLLHMHAKNAGLITKYQYSDFKIWFLMRDPVLYRLIVDVLTVFNNIINPRPPLTKTLKERDMNIYTRWNAQHVQGCRKLHCLMLWTRLFSIGTAYYKLIQPQQC